MVFFRYYRKRISEAVLLPFFICIAISPFSSNLFSQTTDTLEQNVSEHVQAANSQMSSGNKTADFVDKWLINGNAIGNSIGSVVGQSLMALAFGGPVGLLVGTMMGSIIGGYIGNAIDDRSGIAVNYTAFNRPPVTQGGLWLEGVGPWEQFMYQFDAYVLNGGNIAGIGVNLAMNTMAKCIPGLGSLANPILLVIVGYLAGCVADNVDGMIDLGLVGRRIDNARGLAPTIGTTDTDSTHTENSSNPADLDMEFDSAYEGVIYNLRHGTVDSIKSALDGFKTVKDATTDVIQSQFNKNRKTTQ
jgi:hypothetical protein